MYLGRPRRVLSLRRLLGRVLQGSGSIGDPGFMNPTSCMSERRSSMFWNCWKATSEKGRLKRWERCSELQALLTEIWSFLLKEWSSGNFCLAVPSSQLSSHSRQVFIFYLYILVRLLYFLKFFRFSFHQKLPFFWSEGNLPLGWCFSQTRETTWRFCWGL